ncbi:Uncharacterised protein [Moraxella lacunata]|uniref:Uncharacterized protein n=1 Tax=Moraxella lacunata TaxID=477 RepID=A0A378T6Z5_MORLA|nr:hypothetical protein [Moraxella lacunata]STZ55907.1 Uncharacterised protein [Moraxella lacunata]
MSNISEQVISLCQKPNTSLQAIHLLIANNGASETAFRAIYDRVMADNDVDGAYYLANFAQKVDDLPFDGTPLIDMVMNSDDKNMKLALIEKLPKEIQSEYLGKI